MEELATHLQSLQALKPPGVTKTKIETITKLCVENVQSDAAIVQHVVQQFKSSPNTHKLGVIYVVDSFTRQWAEKAKTTGQAISKNAAPGTFASGVWKVTDVLPDLMTDMIQSAPDNQKEKISKLLDIWERGQTFPVNMVKTFKQQLTNPQNDNYTPPGSPPKGPFSNANPASNGAPAAPATGALLAALTGFSQPNAFSSATANPPAPVAYPPFPFPPNVVPPVPGFVPPPPPPIATNGSAVIPPIDINAAVQQIEQQLKDGTMAPEQAIPILQRLAQFQQQFASAAVLPPLPQVAAAENHPPPAQNNFQPDRYEQNGSRYRDRSRSPDYNRRRISPDRRTPPNRRDSPTYGVYDPNAATEGNGANRHFDRERGRGRGGRNRGGRNEFRQRTPPAQRRQPSPSAPGTRNGQPKYIEWDHSLPREHIKVLSRTLFIGGAGGTEGEIRNIFNRFGRVQTCIVNQDKRHAFVKMVNRPDAVSAKHGMDNMSDPNTLAKARQTRWGVGFGPRDCSDYETGVSVIPITRLTDADRKWVVTAEFGGTGGRPLEGGMVLEEPDIEIGAGVSSKAISRRVPPVDAARRGGHGHGHNQRGGYENGPRSRKQGPRQGHEARHNSPHPEPAVGVPPAVPGFGFHLPGF
ncbi:hypothetical protein BDV96DRAFT_569155 [Lophiotrema nucula]|uniref:RNA binding protein Nrd1 n=1 Tax=Lophiotrema nucula TaxID=690887 RepID=A0A6A5ZHX4_9PLEO|nr:hypothetical protein BDV96DRAFT_569155 [Lophiotrema nucula]